MAIKVESNTISNGERVPDEHAFGVPDGEGKAAAEGGNRSPHLRWSGHPDGTESFARDRLRPRRSRRRLRRQLRGDDARRRRSSAPTSRTGCWSTSPPTSPSCPRAPARPRSSSAASRPARPSTASPGSTATPTSSPRTRTCRGPTATTTGRSRRGTTSACTTTTSSSTRSTIPSLELDGDFTLDDVRAAIEGHVLDEGELVATYTLKEDLL